jgi:hypothetical protein
MSPIKKSDVKNHLSSRNRHGIHLHRPASQPDATGFSGEQSGRADPGTSDVVEKTPNLPSSGRLDTTPSPVQPDSSQLVTVTDSKSSRA